VAKLMDAIKSRRSIRVYENKEIPDEVLDQVFEAVRWTPSWSNTQCWEIVVVKDSAIKKELQETVPKLNPARKSMGEAPVVLALAGKLQSSGYYKDQPTTSLGDWYMFDLGLGRADPLPGRP
jgi:nitroreductase